MANTKKSYKGVMVGICNEKTVKKKQEKLEEEKAADFERWTFDGSERTGVFELMETM